MLLLRDYLFIGTLFCSFAMFYGGDGISNLWVGIL